MRHTKGGNGHGAVDPTRGVVPPPPSPRGGAITAENPWWQRWRSPGPLALAFARRLASPLLRLTREGRLLATVVCATCALGVDAGRTDAHVLLVATSSLLFVSVLFSRAYELQGVTLDAHSPPRVTVGDELVVRVGLRNNGGETARAIRVLPPRLPRTGAWVGAAPKVGELAPQEYTECVLRARFGVRGEYRIGPVGAASLVPLGIAQGPSIRGNGLRVVVVPRVADVRHVTMPTRRRRRPGGVAQASQAGDATDPLGVRPYRPGDPIRDLHARSWARAGVPIVREYQQEFFTRLGVVLDTDGAAASRAHFEAALSLTAGIIARLCGGEALVDMLVLGENVHALPLGRHRGSLDQALDLLASAQPGPTFDAPRLLARLGPHLTRLSSLVIVSLHWDGAREGVASAVRTRGVGCASFVVTDDASAGGARAVLPAAITRGEALAL